jgi:hypothetical protein
MAEGGWLASPHLIAHGSHKATGVWQSAPAAPTESELGRRASQNKTASRHEYVKASELECKYAVIGVQSVDMRHGMWMWMWMWIWTWIWTWTCALDDADVSSDRPEHGGDFIARTESGKAYPNPCCQSPTSLCLPHHTSMSVSCQPLRKRGIVHSPLDLRSLLVPPRSSPLQVLAFHRHVLGPFTPTSNRHHRDRDRDSLFVSSNAPSDSWARTASSSQGFLPFLCRSRCLGEACGESSTGRPHRLVPDWARSWVEVEESLSITRSNTVGDALAYLSIPVRPGERPLLLSISSAASLAAVSRREDSNEASTRHHASRALDTGIIPSTPIPCPALSPVSLVAAPRRWNGCLTARVTRRRGSSVHTTSSAIGWPSS